MTRECSECSALFDPRRYNQLTCGPRCADRRRDRRAAAWQVKNPERMVETRRRNNRKQWAVRKQRDKQAAFQGVYVVAGYAGGALVKIGFSTDVLTRFSKLQHATPEKLELLGWIPDVDRAFEQSLHREFAAARWSPRQEFFAFDGRVQEFANQVAQQTAERLTQ